MTDVICREYRPEDGPGYLRVHDEAFPPVPDGYWSRWTQGPTTASVAMAEGEVVGAVPFVFRDLVVRPGVAVRVAWEYSVCVAARLRDTGVGSKLMAEAKRFLPGRCLAMMVYRNTERSAGYRYYARNGHYDLLYARTWRPTRDALAPIEVKGVRRVTWEAFLRDEARHRALYADAYAAYGGAPLRVAGFYAPAVDTPQYNEVPVMLTVLDAGVAGYLIAGQERDSSVMHLMEIAVRDNDVSAAARLLAGFCALARDTGAQPVAMTNDAAPVVPELRAAGFRPEGRDAASMMIMAHVLDPEPLAAVVWREDAATAGLEVMAWTPEREAMLHRSASPRARRITLEMKEDELARLLFCRLDLHAAVAQEIVTAPGATDAEVRAIAAALPFTPWAYHYLDQI